MKKLTIQLLVILMLSSCPGFLFAQFTFFNPKESFAIEVSLENTTLKRLPMYRNSISSLAVKGDWIIGGTSADEGLSPFVFVASLKEQKMTNFKDLNEIVKGQRSIRSGLCKGKNNVFFAGTIANKKADGSAADGHLLRIRIGKNGSIDIDDMGAPVSGEGIFSLLCDAKGETLYGVTYPSGKFFKYSIAGKQVKVFDDIAPTKKDLRRLDEYALEPEDYIANALIEDNEGWIYGSMPINQLFAFNPKADTFHVLKDNVPEVWGRRTMAQVESWTKSDEGILYGGNAGDGQLFSIDPATKRVKNLGKPIMMNRLRGLAFGRDGKLYGIAGALPGYAHLFSFDPDGEGFHDYGNPEFKMVAPGIEQGILWRGFQLGTIAASEDGKYIVMGEDEALSQLLIFVVGEYNEGRHGY